MTNVRRVVTGGCHCGRLRFEVKGTPSGVWECSCSICTRSGYLHWFVRRPYFRPIAGPRDEVVYRYGTAPTERYDFCGYCGFASLYVWHYVVDVNVRCLDDVDIAALPRRTFDGFTCEQARGKPGPWWDDWRVR